jgi:hypothetical protein
MDEFENIVDGQFDPIEMAISNGVSVFKAVVDGAAEVFTHSTGVGLPEELSSELALAFVAMTLEAGDEVE